MTYILYNPLAGNGEGKSVAEMLEVVTHDEVNLVDMTKITNYGAFLSDKSNDSIIICGGDGTLNHFINDTATLELKNDIFYFAAGNGNDFLRDLGITEQNEPVHINEYIEELPVCEVNGKRYRFINNVGFGIDGYCSETGDELRKTSNKPVNYTSIAVKGLLRRYKPTKAKITVDGVTSDYERVWLAPTMNGRFYGGGMMPTPKQNRMDPEHKLSVFLFHDSGKLKTLMIFPRIFSGKHLTHKDVATVLCGKEIKVEFDKPRTVQIDGETIKNVRAYSVYGYGTNLNRTNRFYATHAAGY